MFNYVGHFFDAETPRAQRFLPDIYFMKFVIGPLLIMLFTACGNGQLQENVDRNFMQKSASIILPPSTKDIEIADNGETCICGKFILPKESIDSFIVKYKLQPMHNSTNMAFLSMNLEEQNKPHYLTVDHLFFLQDCKGQHAWDLLLNDQSGELWMDVQYPDWGGMPPNCDK